MVSIVISIVIGRIYDNPGASLASYNRNKLARRLALVDNIIDDFCGDRFFLVKLLSS